MAQGNPVQFLQEARVELAKVVWPSRSQTIKLTGLVIGITISIGLYIGGLDYLLSQILKVLVNQ